MDKKFLGEFCPRCGKQNETLFSGFCIDCRLSEGKLFFVPQTMDIQLCAKCDRIFLRGKWLPFSNDRVMELIKAQSKVSGLAGGMIFLKELLMQEKTAAAFLVVKGELEGEPVSIEKKCDIRILRTTCPACSRAAGGYFEAIIQGRFPPKTSAQDIKAKFQKLELFFQQNTKNDALSRIVKSGFFTEGFDAWIGSKKAAKKASKFFEHQLSEPVKTSFKLHGWEKTKNRPMKRDTFLLRFK